MEGIEGFFVSRQLADALPNHDLKAIQKGKDLLESNTVLACSMNVKPSHVFFTGMTAAAMKTKVSYNYRLVVSTEGDLVNADCECPAGKGPSASCKHVACVALMLKSFVSDGTMTLSKSCTEMLRSFHKPRKSHKGSPVKGESLPCGSTDRLKDPRENPLHKNQANFSDNVRNMMINYKAATGVSLSYLTSATPGRADMKEAVHDHNYLQRPFTEYWVMHQNEVTEEEAAQLERATRKQFLSTAWKEARRTRITASNFGTVCKVTERRDLDKLCATLYEDSHFRAPSTEHGIKHEPIARKKLEEQLNITVEVTGLFVHSSHPHLAATPDGLIGKDCIVEIKCPYSGRNEKIKPGKNFNFLEIIDGKLSLRLISNYYYQVQGQMLLAKRSKCLFVVFTLVDFAVIEIHVNHVFCQGVMLPKLKAFYDDFYSPYLSKKFYI